MSRLRILFILGSFLALIGSFLPWHREGDFISYWIYGIRIFPSLEDNGGALIVILTLAIILLTFRPIEFIVKPAGWNIMLSIFLLLVSIFHIVSLYFDQAKAGEVVGAPIIQIGLLMVFIGSILLLSTSIAYYYKSA